ncbi:MAG: hypothetical protein Q7U94_06145 [Sideroxyarcus sp.]|nr:hypothetical protein [Sideroxyarcus sp.]
MSGQDLPTKLKTFDSSRLVVWLAWILSIAGCIVLFVYLTYIRAFGKFGFSESQDVWGQFGDFTGGTLSPILSFLSLIALVLTLTLQSRQLDITQATHENSKAELEATRDELRRSADAQRQTATALEEQAKHAIISAKLSALRAALDVTSETLRQMQSVGGYSGSPNIHQSLIARKETLAGEILKITDNLCGNRTETQ